MTQPTPSLRESDGLTQMPPLPPKVAWWRNEKLRGIFYQMIVMALMLLAFWYLFSNLQENLERLGIATGFSFLSSTASFDILFTPFMDYTSRSSYFDVFLVGMVNTVIVAVLSIVASTVLGMVLGVARLSSNWLISKVTEVYIEIFRNTPLLLQIFFWYYLVVQAMPIPRQSLEWFGGTMFLNNRGIYVPELNGEPNFVWVWLAIAVGVVVSWWLHRRNRRIKDQTGEEKPTWLPIFGLVLVMPTIVFWLSGSPLTVTYPELRGFNFQGGVSVIPELAALFLALTFYTAAFIGETIRAGIMAVPHGQTEAATSLGLNKTKNLRFVVMPQALRVIIPPMVTQYIGIVKNSSLAVAIGYPELVSVFAGTSLNQTGQAVEIIAMTMAVYLLLSLIISAIMNWYNKRVALVER